MAGTLVVDSLKASSGVLATQNGMTGIAKAWVNFNGTSGTPVIRGSFNVSSVTRVQAGVNTVNYTTAMPNANYAVTATTAGQTAYTYDGTGIACIGVLAGGTLQMFTGSVTIVTSLIANGGGYDAASFATCVAVFV